ncbi:MAG: T9SS type A sorting domain-containing protein [Bacteroidetes bacterium]|nr:T9SS type A sorting domain-containing protein [Bacteroidota bacterium]
MYNLIKTKTVGVNLNLNPRSQVRNKNKYSILTNNNMKISITRYLLTLLVLTMFSPALIAQTSVSSGVTNAGYSLNTGAQAVDPGLVITSSSNITGFKVTISSGLKSSDVLSYTGTLPSGITVTAYNSSTGVITFNGSASAADWQTFLRTVTYSNSNTAQYGDRTITFSAGNLSANSNGHFYELVSSNGTWTATKANAAARTYLGMTGYLATITSAAENAFIRQVLNADAWIGCSDEYTQINAATGVTTYANQAAAEGKWYWVTGPEKGTMFSVGNGSPVTQSGQYANWNSGEPNNSGSEHYGEIYSSGSTPGAWNDLPNSVNLPYVVEYGGMTGDPVVTLSTNTTIYTSISSNTTASGQIICGSTSPSTITGATPYGGYGTYTYKWISSTTSATAGFGNATGTNNTVSYSPGTLASTTWFRRVVTSGSLSDTTAAIAITVNPAVSSTASSINVSCNGASNGSASILASGGTPSFSYAWSPTGGSSATATNLGAGSYTCVVTDASGCTSSQSYTITQPSVLSASTSQTNIACNGDATGAASVSASGGTASYTYSWSPSGGTTASASNLSAGAYTCIITDANGCTSAKNFTLTQPSTLSVSQTITNVACNGNSTGEVSMTPSGGTPSYTYAWSNGGNASFKNNLSAGTYTCTITDANSCVTTEVVTITQPAILSASTASTNVSCNSGSNAAASVNVSGGTSGYTYSWIPSGGTGATASGLVAGLYTCNVTDANGCTTSQNVTITEPSVLAATTSSNDVNCNGAATGSASVSPSGGTAGYTYFWTPSGGTAATATGLTAGNYSCMITDANSCVVTELVTIAEPTAIAITQFSTNVACNTGTNGSASVSVSGGNGPYTFLWSNGGTTDTENNLTAGNYTCTITDANGCAVQSLFAISAPNTITATVSVTEPICFGGEGSATINATGGTGNLTYSWSSGSNTPSESNLLAGTYTVVITDDNGCTSQELVTITAPAQIQNTFSMISPSCFGGTGDITVNTTGGTGAYSYSWTNGNTSSNVTGVNAGNYDVVVTDANGCTFLSTAVLTQPSAITLSTSLQQPNCNGDLGTATVIANGGTGTYSYAWITGGNSDTEGNLADGSYDVVVTDQNGCTEMITAVIVEPTAIATSSTTTNEMTSNDGSIDLSVSGGTAGYTFVWDNGATTEDISGLAAGDYTVVITDANGCTFSTTITVSSSVGLFDPIAGGQVITVYPNPSNGNITLKGIQAGQYRIVDALGRMITSFTVQQQDLVNLKLSNVSNGMYFIQSMNSSYSLAKFNIIK